MAANVVLEKDVVWSTKGPNIHTIWSGVIVEKHTCAKTDTVDIQASVTQEV